MKTAIANKNVPRSFRGTFITDLQRISITDTGDNSRLFQAASCSFAVPADIPQIHDAESAFVRFPEINVRCYCFLYFFNQLAENTGFHPDNRLHDITFHNVSFFNDYDLILSDWG